MSAALECPLCGRLMEEFSQTGDLIGYACPMHDEETRFVPVASQPPGAATPKGGE